MKRRLPPRIRRPVQRRTDPGQDRAYEPDDPKHPDYLHRRQLRTLNQPDPLEPTDRKENSS